VSDGSLRVSGPKGEAVVSTVRDGNYYYVHIKEPVDAVIRIRRDNARSGLHQRAKFTFWAEQDVKVTDAE